MLETAALVAFFVLLAGITVAGLGGFTTEFFLPRFVGESREHYRLYDAITTVTVISASVAVIAGIIWFWLFVFVLLAH